VIKIHFKFAHNNINVFDLNRSITFYRDALNLSEVRRIEPENGAFKIVFLSDGESGYLLELTWLAGHDTPYELGDNESHLAFNINDFEAAHLLHEQMGCICYENTGMGLYFINDPDGYWIEIIPYR
jgi:lactoylglutathione lyase